MCELHRGIWFIVVLRADVSSCKLAALLMISIAIREDGECNLQLDKHYIWCSLVLYVIPNCSILWKYYEMLPCIKAFSPVIIISFDQINKKQIPIVGITVIP